MRFDRRTFVKSTAAGVGASALLPGSGAAKPPSATIDDRVDTDAGEGPQEIIVVFRRNEDATLLETYDLPEGYHRFEVLPMAYTVATGDQIESLARRHAVRRITPNYELDYFNDDASEVTGAQAVVEQLGFDGSNAHAAVIDSGIDGPHPDHQENVVNNFQLVSPVEIGGEQLFVDAESADTDDSGHGSHVSGTVAGDGSQNEAYRGMAPGADLTVYSMGATILILNSLLAYDHLIARQRNGETNVQVVNNSFGAVSGSGEDFDPDDPGNVATYEAYRAGILPCIAAGNCGPEPSATCSRSGDNTLGNTAQAPWVLGVAATHDDRSVTGFSSRGRPQDEFELANYDRQTALENYEEYRRALRHPEETEIDSAATAYEGSEIAGSGTLVNFTVQTADTFVLEPSPDSGDLAEVDGYYATATLTWSPATGAGAPEPSEFEMELIAPDGTVVASAGSNFVDRFRDEASVTLGTYFELPDSPAEYTLEVTCYRGGGDYEVTGELLVVDGEDGIPSPERPFSLERPSIGAPGNGIWSTMLPGDLNDSPVDGEPYYAAISGTSMATPVVTGIVALLNDAYFEENGEYPDVLDVIEAVESTAEFGLDAADYDGYAHTEHNIGKGFVDAEAALEALLTADGSDEGEETDGAAPGIDRFVTEEKAQGSDRNTRYHVDWAVSDAGGDLADVTTELVDDSGTARASESTSVSGDSAADTHRVGTRDDVSELVLTATDAAGNSASRSEEI